MKFPDPTMRLRDVIIRGRGITPEGTFARVVTFPRIKWNPAGTHCSRGTYRGIYQGATVIEDPMLAYMVDLLKYGYTKLDHYTKMRGHEEWNPPEPLFEEGYAPEMNVSSLKEALTVRKDKDRFRLNWPTFGVGVRGTRESYQESGPNAVTMTYLSVIQWGAGTLKNYDNEIPNFRPDDTEERLDEVRKELDFMNVVPVEDSGWKGRKGGRCITDYTRSVQFKMPVSDKGLSCFREMLSLDKCPGWTGVGARRDGNNPLQVTFTTTMDSSD